MYIIGLIVKRLGRKVPGRGGILNPVIQVWVYCKIGYQRMSSQLDYWKAMNAKNAETMSRGSRVPKDSQVDTQSKSRQSHDDISDDISSSRFHGESHEEYREQYNDRNLDQSRNQIYGHGRSNGQFQNQTRKYHLDGQARSTRPSRRNVVDSYSLDSSTLQKETEHIQSSFGTRASQDHSSFDSSSRVEKNETRQVQQMGRLDQSQQMRKESHRAQQTRYGSSRLRQVSGDISELPHRTADKAYEVPAKTKLSKAARKGANASMGKNVAKSTPKDARNLGKSYLPGLDGLRCIAVLAVLLYHISPNQFVGGYIGVDLFFVISGFLITYLNLQKIENPNKTFSLKNFWLRRARRLIPALVLVILVCVPLGALIYPDILVGVFRQVAGALTYTTNWVEIIHGSNYFDQANPSLFKNFWSLAVEEQFYLIWPPILLLLMSRRLRNSQLISIIAAIGLASLVLMGVLATPDNYTRVYYGTDTHCFGLAFGIIFAFIWNRQEGPLSREWITSQKWTVALAPVGLVGFALIVMLVPDTAAFTYPFGLGLGSLFSLFLVGSVIIRQDSVFTRIMELAPMRWVGVRSYSIYLWHWPMLVFGRILIPTALGTVENVAVDVLFAAISFVASDLSYRFVEEPLRKDGFIKSAEKLYDRVREGIVGRIQAAVCVVLVIATIVAIATAPEKTQLQIQIEQQQAAQAQAAQEAAAAAAAEAEKGAIPNYDEAQMTGIPEGSTITAIGDSLISGNSIGFEEQFSGINFLAEPIRQWEQGVEVVQAGIDQGLIRQNVILGFGTNGGVKDEALVREVLDTLGSDRRILLYNIYSPSSFVEESNAIYEKLAEEYPNVYLVDWNSVAAAHPEYLNSDRTHTNIEGQNAFVDAAKSVFSES